MTYKTINTYDSTTKRLRLGRFLWIRGNVGNGYGYSAMLSLSLTPKLFQWCHDVATNLSREWCLTLCGLRLHYKRSYGGIIV